MARLELATLALAGFAALAAFSTGLAAAGLAALALSFADLPPPEGLAAAGLAEAAAGDLAGAALRPLLAVWRGRCETGQEALEASATHATCQGKRFAVGTL